MKGGSGDDILIGGDHRDELYGGSGEDILIAGESIDDDDSLYDDLLGGGNHNDDHYGWRSNDPFVSDTFDGGWHIDYCFNQYSEMYINKYTNNTCEKDTRNRDDIP